MTALKSDRNVVFGTGPLGLSVMDELVARGRQVTMVNRSGRAPEDLPQGVTIVAADVTHPGQVAAVCAEADVVFQCAQPHYHEWAEKFPPIIHGIVDGVSRTEARLVVGDNLYMYGPTDGQPVHEALPYAAKTRKGSVRAELARTILDNHQAGRIKATIGRASDFYGPRVEGSAVGDVVFQAVLEGKAVNVIGDPDAPHTYTYIRDFARGLVTLSEHEEAFGRAWHVPSSPTMTTRQFVKLVGEAAGKPVKLRAAGKTTLRLVGLFQPDVREFVEMYYEFAEPFIVDDSQFRSAFGNGVTPHEQAIRETVAWYRGKG